MTLTNFQGHSDVISENRKIALDHIIIKLGWQNWYQNVQKYQPYALVVMNLISDLQIAQFNKSELVNALIIKFWPKSSSYRK